MNSIVQKLNSTTISLFSINISYYKLEKDDDNMKNLVSIHDLLAIIEHTEGWLSPHEQVALLHLPSMVDHLNGDIVEIGSYKGKVPLH